MLGDKNLLSEEERSAFNSSDSVSDDLSKAMNGSECLGPRDDAGKCVISSRGAGLKFDGGKPQMRLLPPVAMLEMAKVMTFGAEKYEADSWRQVEGGKRAIS